MVGLPRRTWLAGAVAVGLASGLDLAGAGAAQAADPATVPPIPDPPAGMATVVFYRKWIYAGAALTYTVRENGDPVGDLSAGGYFAVFAQPGWHTYQTHAERHDDMQIDLDPGETYYVSCDLGTGWVLYQPSLTPSEQWKFDEARPRLHLTKPLPTP